MIKKILLSFIIIFAVNAYAEPIKIMQTEVVNHAISAFMLANDVHGVAVELFVNGQPYAYYFGEA